ncbi:hypothetical protein Tco_0594978 [Tanacetum coccineum]
MATLKFADSHNMVAFLSKPAKCEGFEQIVDFLNAHTIKYVLTINPTIYTLCIEQFWAIVKAETVNGKVQLQALVDGKKVIITESTIRRDLQLEDVEGVDYLPNATIFEQLALMGTMASAIICLATNQKFNFSKYIFESMVKNLENVSGKFLMYICIPTNPYHTPTIIQPSTLQPQKKQKPRKLRKDTQIPQSSGPIDIVVDEAVNEEIDDSLVRASTTAFSLEAEQDSGSGPRRQDTMGDTIAQTRSENVSKHSNDPLLTRGNTLRSGEDRLKLQELMELCTTLQSRVLALETIKTTQAMEITSSKKRVKKLERRNKSRAHRLKSLYKVGLTARVESSDNELSLGEEDASKQGRKIHDIDADEDITLENVHDAEMFDVNDLHGEEVFVEKQVPVKEVSAVGKVNAASIATTVSATAIITTGEITLAQALVEINTSKPKAKGISFKEPSESTTTTKSSQQSQDKGKAIMVEEHVKPKKKVQIMLDKEAAKGLQAEFDDEDRLAREKDEANVAMTEEWNDIQAKIETDYELAQRLQAEEQEELTVEENAILFQQLLEKRRKHFAAKRAEEKRNRPPTKAQQRSIITELVEGTEKEEGTKKAKAEVIEGSSKRAGDELEQEVTKKQKIDDDQEATKMKELMKIVPDEEEVAIDAIPLATKPLKKKYPLTPATIKDMLNKKLQADHWSEIVNAAGIKVTTAERLQLLEEFMLTEKRSKTY